MADMKLYIFSGDIGVVCIVFRNIIYTKSYLSVINR